MRPPPYPPTKKAEWKAWHIKNNVEGPYIPEGSGRCDRHIRRVKQNLIFAKIDQRLDAILLSPENTDDITDSFVDFRQVRISKLLEVYNKDLDNDDDNDWVNYDPITRGKLREAYENRFKARKDAKIDKWIEKILTQVLKPTPPEKITADSRRRITADEYHPGYFLYIGTERIRRQTIEENERLFFRGPTYHRAKLVQKSLPVRVTRTYEGAGGETEEVEAGSRYQADRNESERQPNPVKAAQGSGHGFEVQGTAYHMGYKVPMDLIEENERLFLKGLTYHRAKRVEKSLPVRVTRTYEGAGGKTKKITFVILRDGTIDVTGDEIGDRFKGFFLAEAKKRKLVTNEIEELAFLARFERSNCFHPVRYFDHPSDYPPH